MTCTGIRPSLITPSSHLNATSGEVACREREHRHNAGGLASYQDNAQNWVRPGDLDFAGSFLGGGVEIEQANLRLRRRKKDILSWHTRHHTTRSRPNRFVTNLGESRDATKRIRDTQNTTPLLCFGHHGCRYHSRSNANLRKLIPHVIGKSSTYRERKSRPTSIRPYQ